MSWKTIFNPFEKFSEKQLMIATILGLLCFGYFGFLCKSPLIGVFKIASDPDLTLINSFTYAFLSYFSTIIVLTIVGKIFNKQTRVIDIANAVGIFQLPLLIILIISSLDYFKPFDQKMVEQMKNSQEVGLQIVNLSQIILLFILMVPFTIYSIILIYNGFKTATNIKSWQKITIFSIIIFLFIIIYQITILNLNL